MYTQCPECLTVYKLRAEWLAQGRGRARCGACGAEIDVLAPLVDELPAGTFTALKRRTPGPIPQLDVPALRPRPAAADAEQRELFVDFDRTMRAQREASPPSFVATRTQRQAPRAGWGWRIGAVAMGLLLLAQAAWAEREPLLRDARVHAFVESACTRLRCTVPAITDRAKIALMARDVRPHPTVRGALVITATLANQAVFAQTYPVVEIVLSDVDERRIAMRRFEPAEYVGSPKALEAGLAPGATATLTLEVEDPGKNAVAFEFRFL
jgi:predicted Zn finger-like uncharacterized protein